MEKKIIENFEKFFQKGLPYKKYTSASFGIIKPNESKYSTTESIFL